MMASKCFYFLFSVIFITVSAVSAPLWAQSCEQYFRRLPTNDVTVNPADPTTYDIWTTLYGTRETLVPLLKRTAYYRVEGNIVPQTLFQLADFSKHEQGFILNLRRLSTHPKYVKRAQSKEQTRYNHKIADSVEMGGLRIRLKNGEFIFAIYTSSDHQELGTVVRPQQETWVIGAAIKQAFARAIFKSEMNGKHLDFSQVAEIQYFHTHPDMLAMGKSDLEILEILRDFATENGGPQVKVSMYAIAEKDGDVYVFQAGL